MSKFQETVDQAGQLVGGRRDGLAGSQATLEPAVEASLGTPTRMQTLGRQTERQRGPLGPDVSCPNLWLAVPG